MTTNLLQHSGKCRGTLMIDLTGRYTISSPSLNITVNGISPGAAEIRENPHCTRSALTCTKCGDTFNAENVDSISSTCCICGKVKPASEIWVAHILTNICTSCKDAFEGTSEPKNADIQETLSYFLIPKGSISFVLLSDILKKSI